MITQEQIADLREGDVVRLRHRDWGNGAYAEGPLHRFKDRDDGALFAGGFRLDSLMGVSMPWELKVISRAPRFYVNADRDPVVGDVATTVWHQRDTRVGPWFYTEQGWFSRRGRKIAGHMPATGNILLYDGTASEPVRTPPVVFALTADEAVRVSTQPEVDAVLDEVPGFFP